MTETIFTLAFTWLIGVFFLLIVYDMYAVVKNKPTVSWVIFSTSQRWPIVPFMTGFIIGGLCFHFFFPIPIPT